MKLILIFLVILSLNLTSASLQGDLIKKSELYKLQLPEETCSSFEYKLISKYFKNFVIKVEIDKENFYIIIKEKECLWYFKILDYAKPDITIMGNKTENSFIPKEIKINTFRGEITKKIIKTI